MYPEMAEGAASSLDPRALRERRARPHWREVGETSGCFVVYIRHGHLGLNRKEPWVKAISMDVGDRLYIGPNLDRTKIKNTSLSVAGGKHASDTVFQLPILFCMIARQDFWVEMKISFSACTPGLGLLAAAPGTVSSQV